MVVQLVKGQEHELDREADDRQDAACDPQLVIEARELGRPLPFDEPDRDQCQRAHDGDERRFELDEKGLRRKGDPGQGFAGFVVTVFGAVGREHERQYLGEAHRDALQEHHDKKQREVVVTDDESHKVHHDRRDRGPVKDLEFIDPFRETRDERADEDGRKGQQKRGESHPGLVFQAVAGKIQAPDVQDVESAAGHVRRVEKQEVLVHFEIAEHVLQADVTVALFGGVRKAFPARHRDGNHGAESDRGQQDHGGGPAPDELAKERDDHRHCHRRDHRADAPDRIQGSPLLLDVGQRGDETEDRDIAERVGGVPQHVGDHRPGDFPTQGKLRRDREQKDSRDGNPDERDFEPGNEFAF